MNLFREGKRFYKGNLHCHTTMSDGNRSPEEVITIYRELGHDFLAITDHRRLSAQSHFVDGMLLLPGIEVDFMLPCEALHLIGIGMDAAYELSKAYRQGPQAAIDSIRKHHGRAILAHPAWSLNTLATLSALRGITAAEIYNSVSTFPWNGDRADSSGILDISATHGSPYCFVASDDSHRYEGEAGRSFTMVQADELTQDALLSAMDAGWFYASQGPLFEQVSVDDDLVTVRCSPVETVIFYSNLIWAEGRCVTRSGLTEATYDLRSNSGETFIRCQLIDRDGKSAWSNPIMLSSNE